MRINKFLSKLGLFSRRKVDSLIDEKRIKVDGKLAHKGMDVDESNLITVDDLPITLDKKKKIYIKVFKPKNYICQMGDKYGRKNLYDLVPINERVYPVGRLDYDSRGLVLLTNDGDFAYKMTHPSFKSEKFYKVVVNGIVSDEVAKILSEGVKLRDGFETHACKVSFFSIDYQKNQTTLNIVLNEGHKRQIREMLNVFGFKVIDLLRFKIGPICLSDLKPGQYKYLTKKELDKLKASGFI